MVTFVALDSLINGSANWLFEFIVGFLVLEVIPHMWQIIVAPFTNPSMMWIVTPLLISMTLMQLYFARHREEELGWSSAFGNSISLIFVSVNLMQFLYNQYGFGAFNILDPVNSKIYLILGIGLISIVQLIINYFHLIPAKIAFFVNSSIPTNLTAYIAIILVYTTIPLTISTFFAAILLLALFIYLFKFIKRLIPMSKEAEAYVKRQEDKARKEEERRSKRESRQERAVDANIVDALIMVGVLIIVFFAMLVIKSFVAVPVWVKLLVQVIAYLVTVFAILRVRDLSIVNLNFDKEGREALLGVLLGFVLLIVVLGLAYISWFLVPQEHQMDLLLTSYLHVGVNPLIMVLLFIVLLPFSVELVFRGVIQRSLKGKLGSHVGVIIQAVLFALITFSFSLLDGVDNLYIIVSIPVFFVGGLLLGYFRDRWGLESAITAHATFNLIGLIAFFLTL